MPRRSWQAEQAKTRQPYLAKLVIPAEVPCEYCGHVRSSHSMLVLLANCRAAGCRCRVFDSLCGCRHPLHLHVWGSAEAPWACSDEHCRCRKFGALRQGPEVEPTQLQLF